MSGRVLVTGAGGFIGSHLTAGLIARGHHVIGLDVDLERLAHLSGNAGLETVEADLGDEPAFYSLLKGVDTVFHLAAAHLGATIPEEEFERVNVEASVALLEASRRCGVRRFVHCSSVGVYGRLRSPPADEETRCEPEQPYERTKLAGERAVLATARAGPPSVIVLRPVWVYGPGCARTEKLLRSISRGRFLVAGRGESMRHCIYVKDMVTALMLAATSVSSDPNVYVIGDAGAVTIRQLVDRIAASSGVKPPRSVPYLLLAGTALGCEILWRLMGQEPPLSRRSLRFFTGNTSFNVTKAREHLGFEASYDLSEGLAETQTLLSTRKPWRISCSDYSET